MQSVQNIHVLTIEYSVFLGNTLFPMRMAPVLILKKTAVLTIKIQLKKKVKMSEELFNTHF